MAQVNPQSSARDTDMKHLTAWLTVLGLLVSAPVAAQQQEESFDYWQPQREMIQHGLQAVLMCNGLFTSDRTLEQVFAQELKYLKQPVGTALGGDYEVDWDAKTVAVGVPGRTPVMRAAFRRGIGCVILAPDQSFELVDDLPILELAPLAGDPAQIPWPTGDLIESTPLVGSRPGLHTAQRRPTSRAGGRRGRARRKSGQRLPAVGGSLSRNARPDRAGSSSGKCCPTWTSRARLPSTPSRCAPH